MRNDTTSELDGFVRPSEIDGFYLTCNVRSLDAKVKSTGVYPLSAIVIFLPNLRQAHVWSKDGTLVDVFVTR